MCALPGGRFTMGSDRFFPEEAPRRTVCVDAFWIDETPVTNGEFAAFVAATGYQTLAEVPPDPKDYPGMAPEMAYCGSLVFVPTQGPVDLRDPSQWWHYRAGACWHAPLGVGSSILGLEDHPVVHIAYCDAVTYARWVGKDLPTEAEWEYAARGGGLDTEYAWGEELAPGGRVLANYWLGEFPHAHLSRDRWTRTTSVRSFPPNGFGLYDMIGNVWEWTLDWFSLPRTARTGCCVPVNPRGAERSESIDPADALRTPRKVLKGGSHLCAPNHCQRYRPAARYPQPIDTSTTHVGFRCVWRPAE
jgi:sulfatase modifying factor 1